MFEFFSLLPASLTHIVAILVSRLVFPGRVDVRSHQKHEIHNDVHQRVDPNLSSCNKVGDGT